QKALIRRDGLGVLFQPLAQPADAQKQDRIATPVFFVGLCKLCAGFVPRRVLLGCVLALALKNQAVCARKPRLWHRLREPVGKAQKQNQKRRQKSCEHPHRQKPTRKPVRWRAKPRVRPTCLCLTAAGGLATVKKWAYIDLLCPWGWAWGFVWDWG